MIIVDKEEKKKSVLEGILGKGKGKGGGGLANLLKKNNPSASAGG